MKEQECYKKKKAFDVNANSEKLVLSNVNRTFGIVDPDTCTSKKRVLYFFISVTILVYYTLLLLFVHQFMKRRYERGNSRP